jgi:hypothetical protein
MLKDGRTCVDPEEARDGKRDIHLKDVARAEESHSHSVNANLHQVDLEQKIRTNE